MQILVTVFCGLLKDAVSNLDWIALEDRGTAEL